MFQFTTTNVVNSNQFGSTGKALWSVAVNKETSDPESFNVKGVNNFIGKNIVAVYKAEAKDPVMARAILDLNTIQNPEDGQQYRLNLYVGLSQGSNNSLYANDFYYKGRPFLIDFVWKSDAATTAKNFAKTIEKYILNVYGGEKLLRIKANGSKIEVRAVNEYQRFIKADIEKLNAEAYHNMGEFVPVISAKTKNDPEFDGTNQIRQGEEGFGTYSWILHNLRLPTLARNGYMAINQEENPIIGEKYNQYTLHYCKGRGPLGMNAVGQHVESTTTHVFYVRQSLATEFEDALNQVLGQTDVVLQTIPE